MKTRLKVKFQIAGYLVLLGALIGVTVVANRQEVLVIAVPRNIEGDAMKEIAAGFTQSGGGASVRVVEFSYDELYERQMAALDSDASPYDVILADDPWLPALVERHKSPLGAGLKQLDLTGRQKEKLRQHRLDAKGEEDFVGACLRVCRYPDRDEAPLYALPFVGNSQLFVYRKAANDSAPSNWHEVIEWSAKHQPGYVMRVGPGNSIVTDFLPILWSAADDPAMKEGREATVHAFTDLRTLGNIGQANLTIVSTDDFDLAMHLAKGTASMSIFWSAWAMAVGRDYLPTLTQNDPRSDLYVGELPGGEPELGAWLLAVPASSRHQEKAEDFIYYATDRERIGTAARKGNPPPRRSSLEDPSLQAMFPSFPCQLRSLQCARPRPRTGQWRQIEDQLGKLLSAVYANQLKPEAAWESATSMHVQSPEGSESIIDFLLAGHKQEKHTPDAAPKPACDARLVPEPSSR